MKSRLTIALCLCALPSIAQTFDSKSTGIDGDLIFTAAQGPTIVFDPNDTKLFPTPLNPAHDNIFNFKKITIPAGVTVKMRADKVGGPVYWLASGDVLIQGTLDLNGDSGADSGYHAQTFAIPGPGRFYGGGGGDTGSGPPTAGFGPQQGAAGKPPAAGLCENFWAGGGKYPGNTFLVPLIGGSGGGGYFNTAPQIGPAVVLVVEQS